MSLFCRCNRAKDGRIGTRLEPTCPEHGVIAKQRRTPVEEERLQSLIAAAYALDRAEQYENGSGIVSALEELSEQLARGEHCKAFAHGELDDILARVHWPVLP